MRKTGCWLAFAVLVLVAGCQRDPGTGAGGRTGPVIQVEPDTLDFGRMEQQQSRPGEVVIRNAGTDTLHIHEVRATCGCTATELPRSALAPGAAIPVQVTFNSQKFAGPQVKSLLIFSNDPAVPELEVSLAAHVHVPIYFDPPKRYLFHNNLRKGESWTATATFTTEDVPELMVEAEQYDRDVMQVELANGAGGDPQRTVLTVTTRDDLLPAQYNEVIRLRTNVPAMPSVDFTIRLLVRGDLSADRGLVHFGRVAPGQALDETVTVTATVDDIEFRITGAEIDIPDLTATVETVTPNRETLIHLRGTALAPGQAGRPGQDGRVSGTLRIHTDLPDQPEIRIRVLYLPLE